MTWVCGNDGESNLLRPGRNPCRKWKYVNWVWVAWLAIAALGGHRSGYTEFLRCVAIPVDVYKIFHAARGNGTRVIEHLTQMRHHLIF